MFFEANSFTRFINNTVVNYGAAIQSVYYSNVLFQGNSTTVFSSNNADHSGGAIYSYSNSCICFEGKSVTMFSGNTAYFGHAINSQLNSYLYFKGNSAIVFSNSISAKCDRVLDIDYKSYVICKGNFTKGSYNAASYGETTLLKNNTETTSTAIFCLHNSKIIFKGHSNVVFNEVSAKWCMNACLPYPTADTVIIDNSGIIWCSNVKAFNCLSDECYCKDLSKKFENVKNNQVVNITDEVVLLSSVIHIKSHNVSVIGHNYPTVICVNGSGLDINTCNNLTIEGITWIGCGAVNAMYGNYIPVLEITHSNNITIQKCSFLYSLGQVVRLTTQVSGYVNITNCTFLNSIHYRDHGIAIYMAIIFPENLEINYNNVLTLKSSDFQSNRGAKSVIHITQYGQKLKQINAYLINCSFRNNQGMSIYVTNHHILHVMGEVLFQSNEAEDGAGIYISDHSTVMFGENSNTKFINNSVYHNGAAIFLKDNTTAMFDNNSVVKFYHNKACNGIVYSNGRSSVVFKATCKVTFNSNSATQYGAAIYSYDSSKLYLQEIAE